MGEISTRAMSQHSLANNERDEHAATHAPTRPNTPITSVCKSLSSVVRRPSSVVRRPSSVVFNRRSCVRCSSSNTQFITPGVILPRLSHVSWLAWTKNKAAAPCVLRRGTISCVSRSIVWLRRDTQEAPPRRYLLCSSALRMIIAVRDTLHVSRRTVSHVLYLLVHRNHTSHPPQSRDCDPVQ